MFMQIIATLFIGGFIALAVIGLVALFHAMLFPPRPTDSAAGGEETAAGGPA